MYQKIQKWRNNRKLLFFCNLRNVTVDYLPHNPKSYKFACIFLIKEAEATLDSFTSSTNSFTIRLRSSPDLYVVDDTTKICEIPENRAYQLERREYIHELGFRHVAEIPFLNVVVQISQSNPAIHLLMDGNRVKIHLCRDSFGELMQIYSDFSFFGSVTDTKDTEEASGAEDDETSFFDAVAPPPNGLNIHTIDDYDPSVQMTQLNVSTEDPEQEIVAPEGVLPQNEPKKLHENASVNPFDGAVDSPFDDVDIVEPNATTFDVPDWMGLDKTKEYVIYGVEDESDIPDNVIRLDQNASDLAAQVNRVEEEPQTTPAKPAKQLVWDSDSDSDDDFEIGAMSKILPAGAPTVTDVKTETKREEPEPEILPRVSVPNPLQRAPEPRKAPPPIRAVPSRAESFVTVNTQRTANEGELDDFLLVEETKERNPIVRIRNEIAEKLKEQDPSDLPPMLGVTVQQEYSRKRKIENILDLPDSFPVPTTRISITGLSCTIILYDGLHWNSNRQSIVNDKNKIEIEVIDLAMQLYLFDPTEKLNFRLGLEIRDLRILDKLELSNRNVMLSYNTSQLRSLGTSMVNVLLQQSTPIPGKPHAMLHLFLLPLRLNIDQDARYFLTMFKQQEFPPFPASATLWEEIRISDIDLQIDYKAKRLERDAFNLCCLNDVNLRFNGLQKKNVKEIGLVLDDYFNKYFWDVILKYTMGLGFLGPIVNLSKGIGNLFYQPYSQYQKNGRLLRGIRQGVTEFGVTLASESLNLGSKMASGTQMVLQLTDDCLNAVRPESSQTQEDSRRYAEHPTDTVDGLQKGMKSVTRGASVAYRHLFVVPKDEFEKHGTGGAVNALVHALPIAVIHPIIGLAEGAKQVSLGARNQLEPKETKDIYKT
uniref:Autophagy-related protein 2 n=1 Tax=Vannella robusta TaxID=1487602 RepID=A0A7S4MKE0_9EUKA|mmetsp:Transcript_25159/g.32001  ORF Transcript_25159/g.32001 Transcript_25159/m.32001 type:complete len:877 (+) Transcript_25159:2780-5410(+)